MIENQQNISIKRNGGNDRYSIGLSSGQRENVSPKKLSQIAVNSPLPADIDTLEDRGFMHSILMQPINQQDMNINDKAQNDSMND